MYNPDGSIVELAEPKPKPESKNDPRLRKTVVVHVDSDEESKSDHLEHGQV